MSGPYGPGCDDVLYANDRAWRELARWVAVAAFGAGMLVGTVLMWWWS